MIIRNILLNKNEIISATIKECKKLKSTDKKSFFEFFRWKDHKEDDYYIKYYVYITTTIKEVSGTGMFTIGYENKIISIPADSKEDAINILKKIDLKEE